jgi:HSP20 family protein
MSNGTMEPKSVITVTPAVNIVESTGAFIVTLDIPGAAKERITANIEDNTLSITADVVDRASQENAITEKQYRREFSLANDIDPDSVDARYELGVLTITLKKKEQYVPKQIRIH